MERPSKAVSVKTALTSYSNIACEVHASTARVRRYRAKWRLRDTEKRVSGFSHAA